MSWVSAVGAFAAVLTCAQFTPQTLKTWKQRNDRAALAGIAVPTFLMLTMSTSSWVVYGVGRNDFAIIIPNSVCLLAVILTLVVVYRSRLERVTISLTQMRSDNCLTSSKPDSKP